MTEANTTETTETKSPPVPPPGWILRLVTRINVLVYKLSGGRWMSNYQGMPICLVTMTGAKSGVKRTIALMYVPAGDNVILVASMGGAPNNPVWYYNLKKHPEVEITQGGVTRQLRARQVSVEEKATLWPTCVQCYPPYAEYQAKTERDIPVFLCEPSTP